MYYNNLLTFLFSWFIIYTAIRIYERHIMNFREKLARFFYGRYGSDQLNLFLMILCMALLFIAFFLPAVPSYILRGASTLIMILAILRIMSRNVDKRRRENAVFMKILFAVKSFFIRQFNRVRYIKTYRYRKCPGCKNHLRFPYKKGEHDVRCPRCGRDFHIKL